MPIHLQFVIFFIFLLVQCGDVFAARYDGKLTITTVDEKTGKQIPVRMELRDARGRAVRVKSPEVVSQKDYFVFDGQVTLELRKGNYQFLIEAGPEYHTRPGHFTIERNAEDETEVVIQRQVDMQAEGWWAGDLDVHHRQEDLPLLMQATGVDFVPPILQSNVKGKCSKRRKQRDVYLGTSGLLDYRRGGGLLIFGDAELLNPLPICEGKAKGASSSVVESASEAGASLVAMTPFAWDIPLWVASGKLDAVQIIHRHSLTNRAVDNEGWGRARDKVFFPGSQGNGRWSESIYHHLLNCGLRLAPAAGSGAGQNTNPVGANRVYVYSEGEFSEEAWFEGLRSGQVVVSNGPLLRPQVEGQVPGYVFHLEQGQSHEFQIGLSLTFYEQAPVEYLEIVKNGQSVFEIRLDELAKQKGRLPLLKFEESGWFLVRAVTSKTETYQYATSGPYYVESNYQPRISRTSVQFFLTWLEEAAQKFANNEEVLADIEAARPFWQALLEKANAE